MALNCPKCSRKLADSADVTEPPLFCMYCGQRLRAGTSEVPTIAPIVMPDPDSAIQPADVTQAYSPSATPVEEAPPPRISTPQRVGDYRLVRFLGAGGMGAVYEAEHHETEQRVAVKLLSNRLASSPTSVERFRQEGRVASQISHPRSVYVLGADADAGQPYIVMELMPGRTLKDLIDDHGPLAPGAAIDRILDVIDGLAEAHRLGVIHRDVKPSNCFLTTDDRIKVGDFGLSKSLVGTDAEAGAGQLTQSGAFLGTVLFASPEQIRGEPVGYDSDVYAVCATLYFLLTRRAPYQHESITASLAKAVSEPPPPIRDRRPDISAEIERVVLKGLERDRSRRWATLDDLRDALVQIHPDRQKPARPRIMVLAYLFDMILIVLTLLPLSLIAGALLDQGGHDSDATELSWPGLLLTLVYFTTLDGILGATLGKRLLRLKVSRLDESGPPGLLRGLIRAVVFNLLIGLIFVIPEQLAVHLGRAAGGTLGVLSILAGIVGLAWQLRRTTFGWQGLHDLASGCHVIQRPRAAFRVRLHSRYPHPFERIQPVTVPLPNRIGSFAVKGKLNDLPDGGEVWLAEDRALGREVLARLFPAGHPEPDLPSGPVRPTRLRALGGGTIDWQGSERAWVAYGAPAGAPLADVVDPEVPLSWGEALPIIEEITTDLVAGESAKEPWTVTSVDQVWVEPGGRVHLLDFPIPSRGSREDTTPASTAMGFIRQVASLALEGSPRVEAGRLRAPLPPHASAITDRIFSDESDHDLSSLRTVLVEGHAQQPLVTPSLRIAHLTVQAAFLAFGVIAMFVASGACSLFNATVSRFELHGTAEVQRFLNSEADVEVLRQRVSTSNMPRERNRIAVDLSPNQIEATRKRVGAYHDRLASDEQQAVRRLTRVERRFLDEMTSSTLDPMLPETAPLPVIGMTLTSAYQPRPEARPLGLAGIAAVIVIFFPIVWMIIAFAVRGGIAWKMAGLVIVRNDGRPIGRFQAAIREMLVWAPVTVLLLATLRVQVAYPESAALRLVLWLTAVALLFLMVVVGIRFPNRPPQDRIVGTHLVPL